MKPYEVKKMSFDAARPYAVVATFRSFNNVVARYEDIQAAKRHARDLIIAMREERQNRLRGA